MKKEHHALIDRTEAVSRRFLCLRAYNSLMGVAIQREIPRVGKDMMWIVLYFSLASSILPIAPPIRRNII